MANLFASDVKLRRAVFPKLRQLRCAAGTDNNMNIGIFPYCYSLEDIQMPALEIYTQCRQNEYYGGCFVRDCTSLKEVNLPSLKKITGWSSRMYYHCPALQKISMPNLVDFNYANSESGAKSMANTFYQCPRLTDITLGLKGAALKGYTGFPGAAPTTCVFHCPADAPYDVDVLYRNGAWEVVTNGTYQLAKWIQGDGGQYFSTGYVHGTNTEVEIQFQLLEQATPKNYEYMWGSRSGNNSTQSFGMYSRYENN